MSSRSPPGIRMPAGENSHTNGVKAFTLDRTSSTSRIPSAGRPSPSSLSGKSEPVDEEIAFTEGYVVGIAGQLGIGGCGANSLREL